MGCLIIYLVINSILCFNYFKNSFTIILKVVNSKILLTNFSYYTLVIVIILNFNNGNLNYCDLNALNAYMRARIYFLCSI